MAKVFHVIPNDSWQKKEHVVDGFYTPTSIATDGFIHLCKADQIKDVLSNFFKGFEKVVLLRIDETNVKDNLKYEAPLEAPHSETLYPHLYTALDLKFVEKEFRIVKERGEFIIPGGLLK